MTWSTQDVAVNSTVGLRYAGTLRTGRVVAEVAQARGRRIVRVAVSDPLLPEDTFEIEIPVDWLEEPPGRLRASDFLAPRMTEVLRYELSDRANGDGSPVKVVVYEDSQSASYYQVDHQNRLYRRAEKKPHEATPFGEWERMAADA